jgi:hypothetical protein
MCKLLSSFLKRNFEADREGKGEFLQTFCQLIKNLFYLWTKFTNNLKKLNKILASNSKEHNLK